MNLLNIFALIVSTLCITPLNGNVVVISNGNMISCLGKESCNSPRSGRSCFCDHECLTYGDCCHDSEELNTSRRRRRNTRIKCSQYHLDDTDKGAFMINTCSDENTSSLEIKQGCLEQEDISDPLMQVPVTDTLSKITYRNRYCAFCNDAENGDLLSWIISVKCNVPLMAENTIRSLGINMTYLENVNKWGYRIENNFYPCGITSKIPIYLKTKVRSCDPNKIIDCPESWSDFSVARSCNSFAATVSEENGVAYKNLYCAICNGVLPENLSCGLKAKEEERSYSFRILLDFNEKTKECGTNQVYDPFKNICRDLTCALPGYQLINRTCHKS